MAKKKNKWLYRALCAALAVTLVSGTAVMSPIADIIGTNITANAAYEGYYKWTGKGTDANGNSATVTCYWKIDNGKLYIAGNIPNLFNYYDAPWYNNGEVTSVYVEEGARTSASARYLFRGLYNATSIDVSNLDTSNAVNTYSMFSGCKALTALDLSSWDTSKFTNLEWFLEECNNLESLNLDGWDVSSVTTTAGMFAKCKKLTSLDLSGWDTSEVSNMTSMFGGCSSLTSLDLSGWNTSKIWGTDYMFNACTSLTSLDLSAFDTSKVTSMYMTFDYCTNLETVYVGDKWNTNNVTNSNYMFTGCENIVGGNGTTYDSNYIDKTYARIDGKNGQKGYFTQGPAPAKTYTVTWKNYDGTTLETDENVEKGTMPEYNGTTPARTATAQYSYTFSGWDKEITAVTGDVTYTAQFTETTNTYTVTWIDGDGNTLTTDTVAYGETPVYSGATPTKEGNAQYTYTFSGWDKAIAAVTGNVTYTAQFSDTVNEYTVTWIDGGGNTLKTDTVAYGETPTYDGATPEKTATAQYTYTFSGWDNEPTAVTGNATYTAQFTETTNTYTVTWVDSDGNTLTTDTVAYGETPVYSGATPTKEGNAQYSYTFSGWDNEPTAVTGNATYTAQFTETTNTYTVTWIDGDGNTLTTDTVAYGETPVYSGATPIKIQDDEYAYTFSGWTDGINTYEPNNTFPAVKSDVTYTATFVSGIKSIVNDRYYYVDDQLVKGFGMIKYQGDYYYVKKNGAVLRDMLLNVTADKTNGLVPASKYKFDADGKMVMKNGIIFGDCYYTDGKLAKGAGLVEVDGDYYYVRANGAIYKNVSLNVTEEKTNDLVAAGKYKFDADGKMVINGIVDGYYYADGKLAKGVGLIEVDGAYYYIKANGAVYKNASLNVTEDKANSLVPAGKYFFDSEGRMTA